MKLVGVPKGVGVGVERGMDGRSAREFASGYNLYKLAAISIRPSEAEYDYSPPAEIRQKV